MRKSKNKKLNLIFVNKKYCNILDEYSLEKCIKKYRPKIILHCAGLSKPMAIHENNISKSKLTSKKVIRNTLHIDFHY